MIETGNQLKAARALIGMEQATLAAKAGVNVNTVRSMEKRGADELTNSIRTVRVVQAALEDAGIVFTVSNGGGPGVRLAKSEK